MFSCRRKGVRLSKVNSLAVPSEKMNDPSCFLGLVGAGFNVLLNCERDRDDSSLESN